MIIMLVTCLMDATNIPGSFTFPLLILLCPYLIIYLSCQNKIKVEDEQK